MMMRNSEFYRELRGVFEEYQASGYDKVSVRIKQLMGSQTGCLDRHGTLSACAGMSAMQLRRDYDAYEHFGKAVEFRYSKSSARIIGHTGLIRYWAAKNNEYPVRMSMREIDVLMLEYSADYWLLVAMGELTLDLARLKRFEDSKKYFGLTLQVYDHFHAEGFGLHDLSYYDPQEAMYMRAGIELKYAMSVLMELGDYGNAIDLISSGPLAKFAQLGKKKECAECLHQMSLAYQGRGEEKEALLAEKNCWYHLPVGSEESYVSCARIYKIALDSWNDPIKQLNEIFGRSVEPVDREKYLQAIEERMKEV